MLSPPANNNHKSWQPRAREGTQGALPMWSPESGRSPTLKNGRCGVHRRPNPLALSLLFLVKILVGH
jgi:hypothetical protein